MKRLKDERGLSARRRAEKTGTGPERTGREREWREGHADATDEGDDERADDAVEATGEVVDTSFGREAEADGAIGATVEWSGGREADGVIGAVVESSGGSNGVVRTWFVELPQMF